MSLNYEMMFPLNYSPCFYECKNCKKKVSLHSDHVCDPEIIKNKEYDPEYVELLEASLRAIRKLIESKSLAGTNSIGVLMSNEAAELHRITDIVHKD